MRVTINDIAKLANVSRGTVDRALNGREGVNPQVAMRIIEIAKKVNYKPNVIAKSLKIREKNIKVGVIIHVELNNYFEMLLKGLRHAEKEYEDYGITLEIRHGKHSDSETIIKIIDELVNDGINALIITPLSDERITKRINELHESGLPIVLIVSEAENTSSLLSVSTDSYQCGKMLGGLCSLFTEKPTRVLYLSASLKILTCMQRIDGFKDALISTNNLSLQEIFEISNDSIISYNQTKEALKNDDFEALVIAVGNYKGIMHALNEHDIYDKKIITLDLSPDVENGLKENKILATINQNSFDIGYTAIKTLYNYLLTEVIPEKRTFYVPCNIVIKESLS